MEPEDKVNVLLVDDRPENLLALVVALEPLGENLVTAGSGKEALRRLLEDDFAVILLDVQMPDMDGFETATLIRERDKSRRTPIIFITAINKSDSHVFKGYSHGAVDYIFKPVMPEILRSKVAVFADLFRKTRQVKRLNETLKCQTVELEAANESLQSFSFSMSHDLRAPVRAINGFAQILERRHRDGLDEEGRRYLGNIVRAGAQMERLIDDLLAYARLGREASFFQMASLRGVLAQVIDNAAPRTAQLGAQVEVAEDLPEVPGDRALLEQALGRVLDNALTYVPEGVAPRIAIDCHSDLGGFTIRVRDNGIGIAREHHEKIFEAFQRLQGSEEYPGTGLGLAIVRRSVGLMGGRVWVESALGEGSTFCVWLPRTRSQGIGDESWWRERALRP